MRKQLTIIKCPHCNTIAEVLNGGVVPVCCGETMQVLVPNTVDAAKEKHIPDVTHSGNRVIVRIGSIEHPMTDEHFIAYIWVVFDNKVGRAELKPGDKPYAEFEPGKGPVEVYEYCTLHGLWKSK